MPAKKKNKSAAIVRPWKKFFGVSCTHAEHINKRSFDKALEFKKDFKPDYTFHLGDFLDTTAFRSGALGTSDGMASPELDLECGMFHITQLEPNLILCGNHEQRLWRFINSPNAIVADVKQAVFGHTHTVGIGMARHQQPSMGINIGCMTDQRNMDYAANRRQTLAWTNAFIYGEYCKNDFKHHLEIVDNERPPVLKAVGQ